MGREVTVLARTGVSASSSSVQPSAFNKNWAPLPQMGRKPFVGKYSSDVKPDTPNTTKRARIFDSPGVLPGGRDIPGAEAAAGAKALFKGPSYAYPRAKGPLSFDSSRGAPGEKKKKP